MMYFNKSDTNFAQAIDESWCSRYKAWGLKVKRFNQ